MNHRLVNFSVLLLSAFCIIGCGPKIKHSEQEKKKSTPVSMEIADIQNDFSFRLFKKAIASGEKNKNFLVSPLSVYTDLGMLYNGAVGQTRLAMKNTLGLQDHSADWLNKTQAKNSEEILRSDSATTVAMANAIYYREDFNPKPAFLKINRTDYHAKIEGLDFKDPRAVSTINHWVAGNTAGKIPSIIDEIKPGESMFLLNAVYFKGRWAEKFDPQLTQKADFHQSDGSLVKVPFMANKKRYNYLEDNALQVIELLYGDGKFSMFVILPAKNKTPETLLDSLGYKNFSKLITRMKPMKLKLKLPKWEGEYTLSNLKNELSAMGMGVAFENRADFSDLFEKESTKISEVKHKTYIRVDEEGIEAAAATSTGMMTTSLPANQPEMIVNRPFLYLIRENYTRTLLFLGKIEQPGN